MTLKDILAHMCIDDAEMIIEIVKDIVPEDEVLMISVEDDVLKIVTQQKVVKVCM